MCWTGGDTNLFCDGCVFGWSATFVRMICNRCTVSVYIYIFESVHTEGAEGRCCVGARSHIRHHEVCPEGKWWWEKTCKDTQGKQMILQHLIWKCFAV